MSTRMDAHPYDEWLKSYAKNGLSSGAFLENAENAHFKEWREALVPLVMADATRLQEDFSSFRTRVEKVDSFLGGLHYVLTGVWERYKNDGTLDREKKFNRPRYWWAHFQLGLLLRLGTKDGMEHVEVSEEEMVNFANEYLSMPWLRHPRLDWLFVDFFLFGPAIEAIQRVRVTLAQQAIFGDQEKFKATIEKGRLSEMKWEAAKGRLKTKLMGHAFGWGIGVVGPLIALGVVAVPEVHRWVAWVIAVPSVLLLLLTAWSAIWWFFGVVRRALGGKDTRPESPATLAQRSEDEAQAWVDVYELLSATAIPVDELRTKVAALPLPPNTKLPTALLALLARIAEKDGAVWVPFPR